MSEKSTNYILLVEDNADDAELTMRALKKSNLDIPLHWVRDGAEALEYLFCQGAYAHRNIHDRPKLILLDLKLPKLNGLEVLEKIKSDSRTKTIPVVMLTSSNEDKDLISAYNHHVNSYIVKPIDFDCFIDYIKQLGDYWLDINIST